MTDYLKLFSIILHHKWYVLRFGLLVGGVPLWRLLIHDWTKFLPSEARYYVRLSIRKDLDGWEKQYVRLLHFNRNPHHWEYWILRGEPMAIPETYVREMVADWMAAGVSYEGSDTIQDWLDRKACNMILHPETVGLLKKVLAEQGLTWPLSGD